MVAVLLAILGVPLWLVAGMLLGRLYSRHRYWQAPGVSAARIVDSRTTLKRRSGAGRWCTRAGCTTCFS
jgi:hypothetical protein